MWTRFPFDFGLTRWCERLISIAFGDIQPLSPGAVELTSKEVVHSVTAETEVIEILVFTLWAGLIADDGSSGLAL